MAGLELLRVGDAKFWDRWDLFCQAEKLSHIYSSVVLRFQAEFTDASEQGQLSFLVMRGGETVAIVPLILEQGPHGPMLAACGSWIPAAALHSGLARSDRTQVQAIIREELEAVCNAWGVVMLKSLLDPHRVFGSTEYANGLLEEGFLDCSATTRIIPLAQGKEAIWSGLRKSFKPLIRSGLKTHTLEILDHANCDKNRFMEFKKLYALAAGKEVYPTTCWDFLHDAIQKNMGMMVLVVKEQIVVGGGLFLHNADKASYALGANHPDHERKCIGHIYLWSAIKYYLSQGFEFFEVGSQELSPQLCYLPTPKEKAISFFKRGFGGVDVPLYRGIKFFDKEVARQFILERAEMLTTALVRG